MSPTRSDPALELNGRRIPIAVRRHARSRTYRLKYDATAGMLRLSMPVRADMNHALGWVRQQEDWVAGQMRDAMTPLFLRPGVHFMFRGGEVRLEWRADCSRRPHWHEGALQVGGPSEAVGRRALRFLTDTAQDLLNEESRAFAAGAGLHLRSVAVGDPATRWGSCSSSGALRFSWRLIQAPDFVRRAIVAHEVAHLRHMDHSPRFHAFHAQILGADPAPARLWLRSNGSQLHRLRA